MKLQHTYNLLRYFLHKGSGHTEGCDPFLQMNILRAQPQVYPDPEEHLVLLYNVLLCAWWKRIFVKRKQRMDGFDTISPGDFMDKSKASPLAPRSSFWCPFDYVYSLFNNCLARSNSFQRDIFFSNKFSVWLWQRPIWPLLDWLGHDRLLVLLCQYTGSGIGHVSWASCAILRFGGPQLVLWWTLRQQSLAWAWYWPLQ